MKLPKFLFCFIIFGAFLAPRIKTSPLKLSVFLTWRKNCKIWWKKIFPHEKRRKKKNKNSLQSQSADLFDLRKKKQLHWKQMLTLCQLLKMERVLLSHCGYKGGIDGR